MNKIIEMKIRTTKKLADLFMPIKIFAAMILCGLIMLYVVSGISYSIITGEVIEYTIPFAFVFQSMGISIVVSLLWGLFFHESMSKKWRFFPRYFLFSLIMLTILSISFFTILTVPLEWTIFWQGAVIIVFIGTTTFLSINEIYYRKTGERYLQALNTYKASISQ